MEPDDLLCLRNARSRTPLVGRAQWKINQPPSLRDNERAWREHLCRSTRAFEDQPGRPWGEIGKQAWKGRGVVWSIPRARRTRTIRQCSFDARSKGQAIQPSLGPSSALKFNGLLWPPRCPTSGLGNRFCDPLPTYSGSLDPTRTKS
jgi:hypothetical protein